MNLTVASRPARIARSSGGPGGVNATMIDLNAEMGIIPDLHGLFDEDALRPTSLRFVYRLRDLLIRLGWIGLAIKMDLYRSKRLLRRGIGLGPPTNLVVQDAITAASAARMGCTYALAYHHQGMLASEWANLGIKTSSRTRAALSEIENAALAGAQIVVFPSRGAKDTLLLARDREADSGLDCRVVHNTPLVLDVTPQHHEVNSTGGVLRIVSVSALTQLKGVDRLPHAVKALVDAGFSCEWTLIGDGPMREQTNDTITRLGLHSITRRIEHRLPRSEVARIMADSDLFMLLHRAAIFDLVILEAMSAGCVPVLSEIGGNIDFNTRANVLFVDESSIARVLREHQSSLAHLQRLNREVARTDFGPERFLRGYLEVFDELDSRRSVREA